MSKTASVLNKCDNVFGSLKDRPDIKRRIYNYLNNPNPDNWDDISGIIISRKRFATIWGAMLAYDPTFPKSGRLTDEKGKVIEEWSRIPTPFEVMKAIQQFEV